MNLVVAGKFDRKRWRSLQLGAYKTILSSFKVGQVDLFQTSKNYLFYVILNRPDDRYFKPYLNSNKSLRTAAIVVFYTSI